MYRTILVAANGGESDRSVFETALALARPFQAHLDFYHVRISPDQSAAREPHVDFSQGRALKDALDRLQSNMASRSAAALRHYQEFCDHNAIPIRDSSGKERKVTASWLEETDDAIGRITFRARHHDLIVIGRPHHAYDRRRALVGQLLLTCGRPFVIAPPALRRSTGVIVVGWKETREAAWALTAAMPLLVRAQRVILASVQDDASAPGGALDDLARELAWHGIAAAARTISSDGRSVAQVLHAAAEAADADFLVIGAYGHSRIRELIFGGVTEALLEGASLPIFLAH
jgi:nucleotide-binding universal stress UspA family protein